MITLTKEIIQEITTVCEQVKMEEVNTLLMCIQKDKRVFVDGDGRSGLIIKCFAMRLMHLGYHVFVIGETITPAMEAGDVMIAVSGSGSSLSVVNNIEKAKMKGCRTIAISAKPTSFTNQADYSLIIPGSVKSDHGEARNSIQLLSSLFDQSLHVIVDTMALMISQRDNFSNEQATHNHY